MIGNINTVNVDFDFECDIEFKIGEYTHWKFIGVKYEATVPYSGTHLTLKNYFQFGNYNSDKEAYRAYLNIVGNNGKEWNELKKVLERDIKSKLISKIDEFESSVLKDFYDNDDKNLTLNLNIGIDRKLL